VIQNHWQRLLQHLTMGGTGIPAAVKANKKNSAAPMIPNHEEVYPC